MSSICYVSTSVLLALILDVPWWQADLLARATKERDEHVKIVDEWSGFVPALVSPTFKCEFEGYYFGEEAHANEFLFAVCMCRMS